MSIIVINPYAVSASVSAPSAMNITDTYSGGTGNGNGYVDVSFSGRGRSATLNVANGGTITGVNTGVDYTVKAGSSHSGTAPTSYAWGSGSGNTGGWSVSSGGSYVSGTPVTGTTNGSSYTDYSIRFTGTTGDTVTLQVTLTGTNSGGSTDSSQFSFSFELA